MSKPKPSKTYKDQHGVVSIIVVSILTITLALIAIGFSKLADRELRQASDRELSAQAYYAAQSGINDAMAYISAGGTSFTGCTNWPSAPVNGNQYFTSDLSGGSNIARYSCISVDSTPQVLSKTVTPGQPWIVKLSAANLQNLYIGWENSSYTGAPAWLSPFGRLPAEDTLPPNTTGVLRAGLYRVPAGDNSDNNVTLSSYSRAYYLYPDGGGGSAGPVAYGTGNYSVASGPSGTNGNFVHGFCKSPRPDPSNNNLGSNTYCNSVITGLDGGANFYYLYLTAQYTPLHVVIQGTGTGPVQFANAQAVIDVTGEGSGQIQRVRATVGLTSQFNQPAYSVLSMETLCKAFVQQILPGKTYQTAVGAAAGNDPSACVTPAGGGSIQGGGTAGH